MKTMTTCGWGKVCRHRQVLLRLVLFGLILAALGGLLDVSGKVFAADLNKQVIAMTPQKRPLEGRDDIGYGNCQWLEPFARPQEKMLALPKFKSAKPVFYAAHFGDAKDHAFTLAIDESNGTGSGYDRVYVDSNNDNRIDPVSEGQTFQLGTTSKAVPVYAEFLVTVGGTKTLHHYHFTAFPYSDKKYPPGIHANLRNGSVFRGEAVFGGKLRKIALADLDSNGRFNDIEQGLFQGDRFFVDLSEGVPKAGSSHLTALPYGEFTQVAGQWYTIVATPDGHRIEITPAAPRFGTVTAPPDITRAYLQSPKQGLAFSFTNGEARAIAGTYRLAWVTLREQLKNEPGQARELEGGFSAISRAPTVTVKEDGMLGLVVGPPLRIEVQPRPGDNNQSVNLKLVLVGIGGELYSWNRYVNRSAPKPGFEIRDKSGNKVASADFEYG
jgi:hypothetical protein